jgi:hypothetical protein
LADDLIEEGALMAIEIRVVETREGLQVAKFAKLLGIIVGKVACSERKLDQEAPDAFVLVIDSVDEVPSIQLVGDLILDVAVATASKEGLTNGGVDVALDI